MRVCENDDIQNNVNEPARPAVTTIRESSRTARPAARANGTVRPSESLFYIHIKHDECKR
jgi:hypothetical protein